MIYWFSWIIQKRKTYWGVRLAKSAEITSLKCICKGKERRREQQNTVGLAEKKKHIMELSETKQDGEGQPVAWSKEETLKGKATEE